MPDTDSVPTAANSMPRANDTWASYGLGAVAEHEDFLVGSSKGLQRLKEHIEIAIEHGESTIIEGGIEFNGVRRLDIEREYPEDSWSSSLAAWGCLLIAAAILVLACVGLYYLIFAE